MTVTAEDASHVETMRAQTGFTGEMLADPENTIAAELQKHHHFTPAITPKKGYPHGMAQPAVIVIEKDETVLYSWAIAPALVCSVSSPKCPVGIHGQGFANGSASDELGWREGPTVPRRNLGRRAVETDWRLAKPQVVYKAELLPSHQGKDRGFEVRSRMLRVQRRQSIPIPHLRPLASRS